MRKMLISLLALAGAGAAHASITPVLNGTPTALGGGSYNWAYDATLASDQGIVNGSYFTLYDFAGFTSFGALPTNWVGSTALLGKSPVTTNPNDDATLLNVTFTYTGPAFNYDGLRSERDLGVFNVVGTGSTVVLDDFTSSALLNNGPTKGTSVATIGSDAVGVSGGDGSPNGVPEPATWAMLLIGFGLVGAAQRRRVSGSVTA